MFNRLTINLLILGFLFSLNALAQVTKDTREFFSVSLNQTRTVVIYKPDSCTATSPCPVLIFLPGWQMGPASFDLFQSVLADLITTNRAKPMLIVVPDGNGGIYNRPMFWNSIVNGNFGDYVAKDLVAWIAQTYPVMQGVGGEHERGYWLIGGFSDGGDACARLALNHPDVFSGFASFSGELSFERYRDWFAYVNSSFNPNFHYTPPAQQGWLTLYVWGAASVFSPDPADPFQAQFPLEEGTGRIREDIFSTWLKSNCVALANDYFNVRKNPLNSLSIYLSAGKNEEFGTVNLFYFTKDYSDTLKKWGIDHEFKIHNLGHGFEDEWPLIWASNHFAQPPVLQHDCRVKPSPENFSTVNTYAKVIPKVQVQNIGIKSESNIQVSCTIQKNGTVISSETKKIDHLKSLETTELSFKEWSPFENGVFTMIFAVPLANDENKLNDTLKTEIIVSELVDDFESDIIRWLPNTIWGISDANPFAGKNCLEDSPEKPYENNEDCCIINKTSFNFSKIQDAQISFWTRHLIEKDYDFGMVEVSADSGKTWSQVGEPITGNDARWTKKFRDLTKFCGSGFNDVRLRLRFVSNSSKTSAGLFVDDISISSSKTDVPAENLLHASEDFILYHNYPNPFNPSTTIRFSIPRTCRVTLKVIDILGREVSTLIDENLANGEHKVIFQTHALPTGTYFYRLQTESFSATRKFLILK